VVGDQIARFKRCSDAFEGAPGTPNSYSDLLEARQHSNCSGPTMIRSSAAFDQGGCHLCKGIWMAIKAKLMGVGMAEGVATWLGVVVLRSVRRVAAGSVQNQHLTPPEGARSSYDCAVLGSILACMPAR